MSIESDLGEVLEQLDVLKSIYPELQIKLRNEDLSYQLCISKDLKPSNEISFRLLEDENNNSSKIVDIIKSNFVEGFTFTCDAPISNENFMFECSWLDNHVLQDINTEIRRIISETRDDTEPIHYMSLFTIFDFVMNDLEYQFSTKIFPNTIDTSSIAQFKKYRQMTTEARLHHFCINRFTCSICLESKNGQEDGILLDCDHCFCKPCLKEFFEQVINRDDVLKLQCPNCPIVSLKNISEKTITELKELLFTDKLNLTLLRQVAVNYELIAKYEKLLELARFEKFKSVYPFSCSECPRCKRWIFRENVDDKLMHCTYCKLAYCFDCNHSWHGKNNSCGMKLNTIPTDVVERVANGEVSEFSLKKLQTMYGRQNLRLSVDSFLADRMFYEAVEENEEMVSCPRCNTVVIKSDGCNKMKCFVCSEPFCNLCGESLKQSNPYDHYNDIQSECYGRLFEGMPGVEDE